MIEDDGDKNYVDETEPKVKPKKRLRPMFENVIRYAARCNANPTQVALWINMVAL